MEVCKNCMPGCEATILGISKPYHIGKTQIQPSFKNTKTEITQLGSICPICGCTRPERKINKK